MRRILLALIVALLLQPVAASAGHGHWHGRGWHVGHRHGWGHSHGWNRWGGYYGGPAVSVSVGRWGYGFGGYGYGYPRSYYAPIYDGCGYGYSGASLAVSPAYGVRYVPRANYVDYYLNTSYEPAELAYGPLAVKQFLGLDRNFALGRLGERTAPLVAAAPITAKTVRLKVRTSNAESRRRADKYIAQGDELFQKHEWNSALQKYKLAGQLAPDVAECFWRQGHGLIAVNQYDQAAMAFRRALLLSDDTTRGGFRLNDLYGESLAAKTSHVESLAGQALETAISAEPFFLIGVSLYYDGEEARAQKFFERAAELSGSDRDYLAGFLAPAANSPAVVPVKADETEI